jgi:hypothetical protein
VSIVTGADPSFTTAATSEMNSSMLTVTPESGHKGIVIFESPITSFIVSLHHSGWLAGERSGSAQSAVYVACIGLTAQLALVWRNNHLQFDS